MFAKAVLHCMSKRDEGYPNDSMPIRASLTKFVKSLEATSNS